MARAGAAIVVMLAAACGGSHPAAPPPAAGASAAAPSPSAARSTAAAGACSLRVPEGMGEHTAVVRLPKGLFEHALAPVIDAACACTEASDVVRLETRIVPARGEVRASAPDDARVDACLAQRLNPGRFDPIDVGAGTDCIDCGPRHVAPPARPKGLAKFGSAPVKPVAPPPATMTISLPLTIDRRHDVMSDAHAPAGGVEPE